MYTLTLLYTTKNCVTNNVIVLGKPFKSTEFHAHSVLIIIISQFCCKNTGRILS